MDRRNFLLSSAAAVVASQILHSEQNNEAVASVSLRVQPEFPHRQLSASFMGLSYESGQLASPGFFAAQNKKLVALFRRLGGGGVLRIGGMTSDNMEWSLQDPQASSPTYFSAYGPEDAMNHLVRGPITPIAIRNLADFLNATDWKLVYGLNLKHGTRERAAEEASFVMKTIGSRLVDLEIGNEADLYSHDGTRWTYDEYSQKWEQFEHAIRAVHPDAPLAGPGVAHGVEWLLPFAGQMGKRVNLLTSHYYAEGPPTNPDMNIERLLKPDDRLAANIQAIQSICRDTGLPYRLAECNSCYHGGKAGVSDTFASAIWGGDFMLRLAQAGFAGVNFHGGGNGIYSPIVGSLNDGFSARPLYYGMLMFSQLVETSFIPCILESQGLNMTAYASIARNEEIRIAIVNKELARAVQVRVNVRPAYSKSYALRLTAPSVNSKTDVTLGAAQVSANGSWNPTHHEKLHHTNGSLVLDLPAASAALVILR